MQVIMTARLFSLGLLISMLGLFVISPSLILSFIIINISLSIWKMESKVEDHYSGRSGKWLQYHLVITRVVVSCISTQSELEG